MTIAFLAAPLLEQEARAITAAITINKRFIFKSNFFDKSTTFLTLYKMVCKDLLLKEQRVIVFSNDCFWYRHKDCHKPSANTEAPAFWTARAEGIRNRNARTFKKLTLKGWTVVIVWSCQQETESRDTARRHYLREYLKTIFKEITRQTILLIK